VNKFFKLVQDPGLATAIIIERTPGMPPF